MVSLTFNADQLVEKCDHFLLYYKAVKYEKDSSGRYLMYIDRVDLIGASILTNRSAYSIRKILGLVFPLKLYKLRNIQLSIIWIHITVKLGYKKRAKSTFCLNNSIHVYYFWQQWEWTPGSSHQPISLSPLSTYLSSSRLSSCLSLLECCDFRYAPSPAHRHFWKIVYPVL